MPREMNFIVIVIRVTLKMKTYNGFSDRMSVEVHEVAHR